MKISLIAAMAKNRVIGRQGDIPWRIPGEQKIFKKIRACGDYGKKNL
jgi:dihydrofolate reductase